MDFIDLRSDTVTHPTPAMRHAMAEAEVGDDVYGEDPTVNRLQDRAAEVFGKEAGLLVSSGTMGNVVSLLAHCGRGERAIVGDLAHIHQYEGGNPAALGGVQAYTVPVQPDGKLNPHDIRAAISVDDDPHFPLTKVVCLENTQGSVGGQPLDANYIDQIGTLCRHHDLKLHIDGARFFNAVAATSTDPATLAAAADSLTFCLSKGLCAPVGSVIVGSQDFIRRAHRIRKMLGGAMRQAGVIAAAGMIALEEMSQRLDEDHANARQLAEGMASINGIALDLEAVKTNMFFFQLTPDAKLDGPALSQKLREDKILLNPDGPYDFRAVTHYWITRERVNFVLERLHHHLS